MQGAALLEKLLENDNIEVRSKSFEVDEGITGLGPEPFVSFYNYHAQELLKL